MRTDEEIVARIEEVEGGDWMGTQRMDLIHALSWEAAQPYLSDEGKARGEKEWEDERTVAPDVVKARMEEYLPFAIGKAEDHRGLSAGRSIDHFRSWAWLLGDEAYNRIDWNDHQNYGAPVLKAVAEHLTDFDWKVSEAVERMARGDSCRPGCDEGCGE